MFRLDQYLQLSLEISRRDARKLLREKRVTVDGELITERGKLVTLENQILLDGEKLHYCDAPRYFVLYKPAGYVSSHRNDGYPSLFRLLDEPRLEELMIAGRLDADTTGLVLLTDDGQWSHRVTHPNGNIAKTYRVTLAREIEDLAITQLETGVILRGEAVPTKPAIVKKIAENRIQLTITEGRYHQVKRMIAAVGNHVEQLHREQVGSIDLKSLTEGDYRPLTKAEIEEFNG